MPRKKRVESDEPVYDLTAEEMVVEQQLFKIERDIIATIERHLANPKIQPRDLSYLTQGVSKLRSETRLRYKLRGKLNIHPTAAAEDPETAKLIATAYLNSLPALDRASIFLEAQPKETLQIVLVAMETANLRDLFRAVKDERDKSMAPVLALPEAPKQEEVEMAED